MNAIENNIQQLRKSEKSWGEIKDLLLAEHLDAQLFVPVIEKLKKEYHDKHLKLGKIKILLGLSALGLSFLVSCIHFHANLPFTSFLYGFTTAGLVLVGWGAYDCLH